MPHAIAIAQRGVEQALLDNEHLRRGLTVYKGKLTLLETAEKHNMPRMSSWVSKKCKTPADN